MKISEVSISRPVFASMMSLALVLLVRLPGGLKSSQGIRPKPDGIPGVLHVDTDLSVNRPELTVNFDRDRADDFGVLVADVVRRPQGAREP